VDVHPEHGEPLSEDLVDPDPLRQFSAWFARAAAVTRLPEAVALATVTESGDPAVRMVLLKGWDEAGFVFYTSYESDKGHQLAAHPVAALVAYWDPLGRQVRVEGPVTRVSAAESDAYFATRPRGHQVGAHASAQSRPVAGRAELEERVGALEARYADGPVPRPDAWGGYRLAPRRIEFWQNREDRLHDRLLYLPEDGGWRITRLQP
jgi:pyridoxamine 5'-phosphate oxidase